MESNIISISWDVIFHEDTFLFTNVPSSEKKNVPSSAHVVDLFGPTILPMPIHVALDTGSSSDSLMHNTLSSHPPPSASATSPQETVAPDAGETSLINTRPKRNAKAPGWLFDYH